MVTLNLVFILLSETVLMVADRRANPDSRRSSIYTCELPFNDLCVYLEKSNPDPIELLHQSHCVVFIDSERDPVNLIRRFSKDPNVSPPPSSRGPLKRNLKFARNRVKHHKKESRQKRHVQATKNSILVKSKYSCQVITYNQVESKRMHLKSEYKR